MPPTPPKPKAAAPLSIESSIQLVTDDGTGQLYDAMTKMTNIPFTGQAIVITKDNASVDGKPILQISIPIQGGRTHYVCSVKLFLMLAEGLRRAYPDLIPAPPSSNN